MQTHPVDKLLEQHLILCSLFLTCVLLVLYYEQDLCKCPDCSIQDHLNMPYILSFVCIYLNTCFVAEGGEGGVINFF